MVPLLYDVTRTHGDLFILATAVWYLPEFIGTFLQRSSRSANRQDRGSYLILLGGMILGLLVAFASASYLPMLANTGARYVWYWLGMAFILLGVFLRWYSIIYLGKAFTRDVATDVNQKVVSSGPYRLIRHPAYSGTMLTMLGVGITLSNWGSIVILLVIGMASILYRIKVEEKALLEGLGQPYRDYIQRTKRMIPYIW
jgi:protein-S-isoprenylcysteine O-methyltransferase Ste14